MDTEKILAQINEKKDELKEFAKDSENFSNTEKTSDLFHLLLDYLTNNNENVERPAEKKQNQIDSFLDKLNYLTQKKNEMGFNRETIKTSAQQKVQNQIDKLLKDNNKLVETIQENIKNKNEFIIKNIHKALVNNESNNKNASYALSFLLNSVDLNNLIATVLVNDKDLKEVNLVEDNNKNFRIYDINTAIKKPEDVENLKNMGINDFVAKNKPKIQFIRFEKLNSNKLESSNSINDTEIFESVSEKGFEKIIDNLKNSANVEKKEMES